MNNNLPIKTISSCFSIVLIWLLLPKVSVAQSSSNFYMHMKGHLANSINLSADLVRIEGKLSGYYYYYFLDTLQEKDFGVHYGKSMPVSGTIAKDNTLEFSEYSGDIKGAIFRGRLKDGQITGEWVSSDSTKTLPFDLTETYPEGTIAFYVYHLSGSQSLLENKPKPAAKVDLTLLLPKPYAKADPVDSVNATIKHEFFNINITDQDPQAMLKESRDMYFKNYKTSNEDIYRDGDTSFDWEKVKAVRIQYNEHQILSLEFYDYGFTGGAHGLSISKFVVISLNDGHRIRLDEIFRPDYTNDLSDILNSQARKQYDLDRGQDLRDGGFFVQSFSPTDNFYLNKDGIGFYYNQYEVAPYAMGPIDIFIPYQRLVNIMNKEGEVYKAILRKE